MEISERKRRRRWRKRWNEIQRDTAAKTGVEIPLELYNWNKGWEKQLMIGALIEKKFCIACSRKAKILEELRF